MKITFALVALLCFTLAPENPGIAQDTSTASMPTNRVELFNGRDFTGWTFCTRSNANPALTWTVTNGVIHCTGKPTGYLRTVQAFSDYALTVEWRFVKVAPKGPTTPVSSSTCSHRTRSGPPASRSKASTTTKAT